MIAPLLLAVLLVTPALAAPAPAAPPRAQDEGAAVQPLADHEVARVAEVGVSWDEFHRYLGTVYDRLPEGEEALRQLVLEVIVRSRAASLGLDDPARIDRAVQVERDQLLARGLAAGADPEALRARLDDPQLAPAMRLLALQKLVLRAERDLPVDAAVDDETLGAWADAAIDDAQLQREPLEQPLAARFDLGVVTRTELGRRVEPLLSPGDRSGVLTELLGIVLVHRKAAELGVSYDPAAAADELSDRERYVLDRMGEQGVSYDDVLGKVEMRSREELVASPAFTAQVVLRQLVATSWDEQRARAYWEEQRERFARRFGPDHGWDDVSHVVWREVRQRTYQQLFAAPTIQRRF